MIKWILTFSVLVVSPFCSAQERCVLDLTNGVTWAGVFQSGFRPQYVRDGKFGCRQLGVDVVVKTHRFPDGIHLGVGDVDFNLLENHMMIGFSFYGRENRSLAEAKKRSEAFAKMFGEELTRRAEFKTFETEHAVDYRGDKLESPQIEQHVDLRTASNAAKVGGFSIIYGFADSYRSDLPLVERLSVALKSQEASRAKNLTEKIRPPAGYEHVSLEPDQLNVSSVSGVMAADAKRDIGGDRVAGVDSNPEPTQSKNVARGKSALQVIIGGLLLIGILVSVVRIFRSRIDREQ